MGKFPSLFRRCFRRLIRGCVQSGDMPPPAPRQPGRSSSLSYRLGVYLMGVAIGVVLVGFLLSVRGLILRPAPPAGEATQAPAR